MRECFKKINNIVYYLNSQTTLGESFLERKHILRPL